ncbi:Protein IQ-DOMAIN 1 [Quillaja saponaria]|uniref:Protein IQ-DOMAIN 1 n=1 Tax=Quillaja saponaria TaxID=32244 RepID=A0AAD7PWV5_QUISA|nr:Protein IQ-DOMAIN 1 [Quillaja saponaria]
MGRKGSWLSLVKRVFTPGSKEKEDQKTCKSKKKWLGKQKSFDPVLSPEDVPLAIPPLPPIEDVKLTEAENEQSNHAYSVALATGVAAEAAVAAAQAAAEVVCLTAVACYPGKSEEGVAAIKIQTAFRGYLARRALRALRGLVRLKTLTQGQSVKRQAATTLQCMQTLARVQSQIHARRIRMSEENQALQRQLQQKCKMELEKFQAPIGEEWDDSPKSKEQIEAKLLNRQEAAMKRERALAYAFSHQQTWKNSSKQANPPFMNPNNPLWGWSWLERWMAARPWESQSNIIDHNDRASVKITTSCPIVGEIKKSYSLRDFNHDNKPSPTGHKLSRPPSRQSPCTPPSEAPSSSSLTGKTKLRSLRGSAWGGDDGSRSLFSVQSESYHRHSIAGSSVRDDESLASSPAVLSYKVPSKSAKSKSRLPSPLGLEKNGTPEKGSVGSVKKRLSFPASPAGSRRHSGPPKVQNTSSFKDIAMLTEDEVCNGGGR